MCGTPLSSGREKDGEGPRPCGREEGRLAGRGHVFGEEVGGGREAGGGAIAGDRRELAARKAIFACRSSVTRGRAPRRPLDLITWACCGAGRWATLGRRPSAWMAEQEGPLGCCPAPGDFISWPDALPRPSNTYPSPVAPAPFFLRTLIFSPSPPASVLSARPPLSG